MRLSKEAKITDEKLFCESHRQRVLAGGKLSEPYLKRLEKYAFDGASKFYLRIRRKRNKKLNSFYFSCQKHFT